MTIMTAMMRMLKIMMMTLINEDENDDDDSEEDDDDDDDKDKHKLESARHSPRLSLISWWGRRQKRVRSLRRVPGGGTGAPSAWQGDTRRPGTQPSAAAPAEGSTGQTYTRRVMRKVVLGEKGKGYLNFLNCECLLFRCWFFECWLFGNVGCLEMLVV